MSHGDDAIRSLREALRLSPDNVPLHRHLASTLAGLGRFEEAELEYRSLLEREPDNAEVKIDLARVYHQQGKTSHAMVIVEDLAGRPGTPAAAHVLYARLLLREGDVRGAVAQYKLGIEIDPDTGDRDLAELRVHDPRHDRDRARGGLGQYAERLHRA